MKRPIPYLISISCFILSSCIANAANPPISKWTVKNPFEQKVFIENKGQYEITGKVKSKDILFGARQDGLEYYFTQTGIWIKRNEAVKRTEEEINELKQQLGEKAESNESNDREFEYKTVEKFHEISLVGSNSLAIITGDDGVSQYYNYTLTGNVHIKANAYKKITYQNLYPGIDMELYFPADKQGFEYSFIVHPGADISQIKIQYPLNEGINLTSEGNITIKSDYGLFTDHAPVATINSYPFPSRQEFINAFNHLNDPTYKPASNSNKMNVTSSNPVSCSFTLQNGIVQFKTGDYDKTQDLIIDPWMTTPIFTGGNKAYDVDWDMAGNCYVYGGNTPFQVLKFDSTGKFLWSYTENFTSNLVLYGGFAVDKSSQSVYIIEGFDPYANGCEMIKVNSSGSQAAFFNGDPHFTEMWRVAFSSCIDQAVVVGGGISSPSLTGYCLDTTLTVLTPVNIINSPNGLHDMWGITLDDFGNCYTATAESHVYPTLYDNIMLKLVPPNLVPALWTVNDNYDIQEVTSVNYTTTGCNGFNGMTVSDTDLYTYDSYVLKEWNTSDGVLVDSLEINGNSGTTVAWGGITANDCNDIFLGSHDTINQYDANLNLVHTIDSMPGYVYDVSLNKKNILFACGDGFVSAIQVDLPTCYLIQPVNSVVNSSCLSSTGSDTLSLSGGTRPYTVTWNTKPQQTGTIATNLSPGTYVATITDNSCPPITEYDTIHIQSALQSLTVNNPNFCKGDSVTLIASGATTYNWFPSVGLSATTGDTVIAYPAVTTTYSLAGMGIGGCSDTIQSVVTVDSLPQVGISNLSSSICYGQSVSLTVSGASTYQWSPAIGLNITSGDSVIAAPTISTDYTIVGFTTQGCADTISAMVTIDSLSKFNISNPGSVCIGQSASLTASGAVTYQWSPSTGLNTTTGDSAIATPSVTTTYYVTATDSLGCTATDSSVLSVTALPDKPTITRNGNVLMSSAKQGNQWLRNDTILQGATNQTYTVSIGGWYEVTTENPANGCSSTSDSVYITPTGIDQLTVNSGHLTIYPNPTSGEIFININSSVGELKGWNLQITDVLGRTIYVKSSLSYSNTINLSNAASGVYFIIINAIEAKTVFPVIKQE